MEVRVAVDGLGEGIPRNLGKEDVILMYGVALCWSWSKPEPADRRSAARRSS